MLLWDRELEATKKNYGVSKEMIMRDKVVALLTTEIREFIVSCIQGGLADYYDPAYYGDAARREHTPGVRAAIRNCHILARANRATLEMSQVRAIIKRGRVMFIVADRLCVSFKKLNRDLRPRYVRTRQAEAFAMQTLWSDSDLPPMLTNVFAGYVSDAAETEF